VLSQSRFQQLHKGLSANAKKVYDAVPAQEAWLSQAVHGELMRQGLGIPFNIVEGCLQALRDAGLAKESAGRWTREPVKPAKEPTPAGTPMPAVTCALAERPPTPTEALAEIAARLRRGAQEMLNLAEELDSVTLALEETLTAEDEDVKRLRKLRDAMKEAGLTA